MPHPPQEAGLKKKKTLVTADPAPRGGMGKDTIPPTATVMTLPHKPTKPKMTFDIEQQKGLHNLQWGLGLT